MMGQAFVRRFDAPLEGFLTFDTISDIDGDELDLRESEATVLARHNLLTGEEKCRVPGDAFDVVLDGLRVAAILDARLHGDGPFSDEDKCGKTALPHSPFCEAHMEAAYIASETAQRLPAQRGRYDRAASGDAS